MILFWEALEIEGTHKEHQFTPITQTDLKCYTFSTAKQNQGIELVRFAFIEIYL